MSTNPNREIPEQDDAQQEGAAPARRDRRRPRPWWAGDLVCYAAFILSLIAVFPKLADGVVTICSGVVSVIEAVKGTGESK